MIAWLARVFGFKRLEASVDELSQRRARKAEQIEVGQIWQLKPTKGDPWESTVHLVKVIDVCQGWVRYDMGAVFRDNRMKSDTFLYCYRRVS